MTKASASHGIGAVDGRGHCQQADDQRRGHRDGHRQVESVFERHAQQADRPRRVGEQRHDEGVETRGRCFGREQMEQARMAVWRRFAQALRAYGQSD